MSGVGSAQLCEECSNDIHQSSSAVHNIKAVVSEPSHSEVMLNYVSIILFCVIQLYKEDCEKPKKPEECVLFSCPPLSLSLSPSPPLSQFKYCFSLCSGGSHWLASEISCVEKKINEVQTNCHWLQEQVKQAIDDFKQLLDTRQTVSHMYM